MAGSLALEELSERVERALAARTRADLDRLTSDLPSPEASQVASPMPVRRRSMRRAPRWTVACMSEAARRGRWRLGRGHVAVAFMGGVTVDLRGAELELDPTEAADEIEITAVALMGGVEIIVPEGVHVELSGFALMGRNDSRVREAEPLPGMPSVHVRAFSLMGGVEVRSKPARWPDR